MESLFEKDKMDAILARFEKLNPDSKPLWGKMDAAQMLAHCKHVVAVATGDEKPTRVFVGRIIGQLVKSMLYNDKPFPKNSPTMAHFKIVDPKVFEEEKQQLIHFINRFQALGIEGLPKHKHAFFGRMSNVQWGLATYKHLIHHLDQFGL